jgi:glycosyltransferase involved in cell wall biosynthesis
VKPEHKNKIIILTDWFLPGYRAGGPIQSCFNFVMAMKAHYEIFVITSDTDLGEASPYADVVSNQWVSTIDPDIHTYYFSKSSLSYGNILSIMKGVSPDFIYLNHMFSPYFTVMPLCMWWRKQVAVKLVLCPRGALFDSALHHKRKFAKKIILLKLLRWLGVHKQMKFHATNEREAVAIQKYFPTENVIVANNLANHKQDSFEVIEKRSGHLRIIFVSRIVPIKNLSYLLHLLSKMKSGTIVFTIVGPAEDNDYWEKCKKQISDLPSHIKVEYLGPRENRELSTLIKKHHLFVLPTQGENFGHSIFESFLAGRPVLISDQTPWRSLETLGIGWDVALSEAEEFLFNLHQAVEWDQLHFNRFAKSAWDFAEQHNNDKSELTAYRELFS